MMWRRRPLPSREAWAQLDRIECSYSSGLRPIGSCDAPRETHTPWGTPDTALGCKVLSSQTQHQDVIRDMRREMSDMQAELLALREQQRRASQPGPEARIPDHPGCFSGMPYKSHLD
ncbi:hypothetical protein Tco_1577088 [Tanacetum coccineum]